METNVGENHDAAHSISCHLPPPCGSDAPAGNFGRNASNST